MLVRNFKIFVKKNVQLYIVEFKDLIKIGDLLKFLIEIFFKDVFCEVEYQYFIDIQK